MTTETNNLPALPHPTDEILERIIDAHCNRGGPGVIFRDIHQHNACHHTLSGEIDVDGVAYGFIIESGDWNGTVVKEWGLAEDVGTYRPEPPSEPLAFVPINENLHADRPAIFSAYLYWRDGNGVAGNIVEQERNYAYNRHFAPGGATEKYYREWAAKFGLRVGLLSEVQGLPRKYKWKP